MLTKVALPSYAIRYKHIFNSSEEKIHAHQQAKSPWMVVVIEPK
jgi:hypothetical protein